MRYFYSFFLTAIMFVLFPIIMLSKIPTPEQMLFNSAQGREFYIAIPPNEADGQPLGNTQERSIDIYVTSSKNCNVTVEIPGLGYKLTKPVQAMKITTFNTFRNETSFQWEVRESEKVLDLGIHVYADQPISVYVMNTRMVTSDGFLAIPTSACGTDYIHLAYYDFFENITGGGERRGAGFIICATEDNTRVRIVLKGVGGAYAKTLGGRKIGDTWTISLNKGQVYCVMGDGNTRGQFDISGSRITSDKPIGLISFHKRTLLPSYDLWNGRDHMCEMIPPVTAWGKKYSTVEFKRNDHGDFFRIIAAQDNTTFTVKWYSLTDGRLIGQAGPHKLNKSGDFMEFIEAYVERNKPNVIESIKGTSVWEADKPVLVMQYSYSAEWDNAAEFDPFMVLVVPTEQFIPSTVFQTPEGGAEFNTNWFNIVAVGDPNDPNQELLKSIILDGKPVWSIVPQFLYNRIPTTDLYWAKIPMTKGAHVIKGNTKFGGYIYGFSEYNSYGWPAAMAINKLDETDTLPPEYYITGECGDYQIRTTEFRTSKNPNDDPRQVDQGIADIFLLEGSYNYELDINNFKPFPVTYDHTFFLKVIDKTKDGKAVFQITDRAGNYSVDSVFYKADKLELNPNVLDFKTVRLTNSKTIKAYLTNTGDSAVVVKEVKLKIGGDFKITNMSKTPEFTLQPKETMEIDVTYTPSKEGLTPNDKDRDTLDIVTKCADFLWPMEGRGVVPRIIVQDWNFGAVVVGKKAFKKDQSGEGLQIQNVGTDVLTITDIIDMTAPFEFKPNYTPALPIVLQPNEMIYLDDVGFAPTATGPFEINVKFVSDAVGIDDIAILKGVGIIPGPRITSKDWEERRVKTIHDSVIHIYNEGTSKVTVTAVKLGAPSPHFRITKVVPDPSITPVALEPVGNPTGVTDIVVFVQFEPQIEGQLNSTVVPEFDPNDNIAPGSVVGDLAGFGILPKIEVIGDTLRPAVLVGTQHPKTAYVTIKSTSTTADLYISEIKWSPTSKHPGDFVWVSQPPSNFILKRGDSIKLPVYFTPSYVNERITTVDVISDAVTGPEPINYVTTSDYVVGYGYESGIINDSINYGLVLLCDEPVRQFKITNTSSTTDAVIDSVVMFSGDINNFSIEANFPQTIGAQQTRTFNVRFKPDRTGNFSALARIYSSDEIGDDHYVLLQGVGYTVPVNLKLKEYTSNDNLAPGIVIPIEVTATSGNWIDAGITEIQFDMIYDNKWLKFGNAVNIGTNLDNSWQIVSAVETSIDANRNKTTIRAKGTNPISGNGVLSLFQPRFQIMLSDIKEFPVQIANITTFSRDVCVTRTGEPGKVVINTCVVNLRPIVFSKVQYSLHSIDPNPVSGETIKLTYDVALDGYTRLELINSIGEVIGLPVSHELESGRYEALIPIENLASGVYYVRMISGPYTDTKAFVIAR